MGVHQTCIPTGRAKALKSKKPCDDHPLAEVGCCWLEQARLPAQGFLVTPAELRLAVMLSNRVGLT